MHEKARLLHLFCFQHPTFQTEFETLSEQVYAVLLEVEDGLPALLADRVAGVFEVPDDRIFELPEDVTGEKNDFLTQAVYLDSSGCWAFVMDIERFLNKERN